MKKSLYLLLFFLTTISIAVFAKEKIPAPDLIAHEIIDATANTLEKKYDLHPIGLGMNGKFKYLEISFEIHRPIGKDEARMILVDSVNLFLANLNSNKKIRPYLKDYPFTMKNAGISLFIKDKKGADVQDPQLSVAFSCSDGLYFQTKDPKNPLHFKATYEETHEEALALVQKQSINPQPELVSKN